MKETGEDMLKVKNVVVAMNEIGDQGLYVDGELKFWDGTIYPCDIVKEGGIDSAQPIYFTQVLVLNKEFPNTCEELIPEK